MKKIIALILCVLLSLTLYGCKKTTDNEVKEHSVDVEYYAKIGNIPEHKYQLGADATEMENKFKAEDEANNSEDSDTHNHSVYSLMEADDYSFLSYGNANYYFKKEKKIGCIVSLDTSYGFQIGALTVEVKEALNEFSAEEKQGNSDVLFFLPSAESYTYLEYTFGENNVIFAFQNSSLCAAMIYNPKNWN